MKRPLTFLVVIYFLSYARGSSATNADSLELRTVKRSLLDRLSMFSAEHHQFYDDIMDSELNEEENEDSSERERHTEPFVQTKLTQPRRNHRKKVLFFLRMG